MLAFHRALCIVFWMTTAPNFIIEAGWQYLSRDQWWPNWEPQRVLLIVRHWRRRFRSTTGRPPFGPDEPGQVVTNYKGFTANETELCQYCYSMPSTSNFPKSSCGNGTTTTLTPKVNPPQQIFQVWLSTIHPGAATTQVQWRPECCTTQRQCRSEHSSTPKPNFWGSETVHGGNRIHKDSWANVIQWHILDGWRSLESCH